MIFLIEGSTFWKDFQVSGTFSEALRMQVLPAVLRDLVKFPPPGMLFPNPQNELSAQNPTRHCQG